MMRDMVISIIGSLIGSGATVSIENAGYMRPKLNGSTGASGVDP